MAVVHAGRSGSVRIAGGVVGLRRRQLLTGSGVSATAFLEAQNFRPPDDEADGVFPDGRHTTVERNPRNFLLPGMVEIWKLVLDGSGS